MTYNDIVLHALRTAGQPLASHELFELPACEGMTRQQVSSAVGHLRRAGKIKETWGTVPGPLHGPKEVRQYEVTPQEDGLDEALIEALAASTEAAPTPTAAAQAEQSRLEATRPPRAERAIPRTGQPAKPAVGHPFTKPISPKAPADRRGRITRDLPGHLVSPDARLAAEARAIYSYTPKWDRLDPEDASQEADYLAAEAESEAEATTEPEASAGAESEDLGEMMLDIIDDCAERLKTATAAAPSDENAPHQCCGKCRGHDQGKPAKILPSWVADLQAWLGLLPVGMSLYKLVARYGARCPSGDLRICAVDDGGGAFAVMNAKELELNAGEMACLARYGDAIIWIFDAMAANAVDVPVRCRPHDLDQPKPNADFGSYLEAEIGPRISNDSARW